MVRATGANVCFLGSLQIGKKSEDERDADRILVYYVVKLILKVNKNWI